MTNKQSRAINWRAFTSMFILFSFLIIGISGIILYFAPPGRIAHWSQWTLTGLTKESWQSVHTIFAFTFIITAIFHLKFNWKPLMAYIKKKLAEGQTKVRKELALSALVSVGLLVLTLVSAPPFSTIMSWGEALSNAWADENTEPPIPHAELMTLEKLAQNMQIPLSDFLQGLQEAGIRAEPASIIGDLARENEMTPSQIYARLPKQNVPDTGIIAGGGYGRKTVAEVCKSMQKPVSRGLQNLKQQGIEATPDTNVRELASRYDLKPIDIVKILQATD